MENLNDISSADQTLLDFLAKQKSSMINRTLAWSKVNTGSWNLKGLKRLAPLIAEAFKVLPAEVRMESVEPIPLISEKGEKTGYNTGPVIWISVRPEAKTQLVMSGHYDTVFPHDLGFNDTTQIDENIINGPGLADMKGGLVVMLEALKALELHPRATEIGYHIVISPDEEIGNPASAAFLTKAARPAMLGMTYEPALETSGDLSAARKGSGVFNVIIGGRAAHAGRAHADGRSAIRAAAQFIMGLEADNNQCEGVSFNTGKIDGGGPVNQVPDCAVVRFNVRVPDAAGQNWAIERIDQHLNGIRQLDGITAELEGRFTRPPKPFNRAQQALFCAIKDTGHAIGLNLACQNTGGVCEGNNIFAAGTPNIDTLGVRGGKIHSVNEYVELDSFVERASLSALFLSRIVDKRLDVAAIKQMM